MSDLKIIYGIGATKAGTSWLYEALCAHPQVHARSEKELHYWSSDATRRAVVERQIAKAEANGASAQRIADLKALALVVDGPRDGVGYVEYLCDGRAAGQAVIDSTPAYSMLEADTLRAMAKAAPLTRFVYLMRDPVERLWSHVRMMAKRSGGELARAADRLVAKFVAGEHDGIAKRSDYVSTLDRLTQALPDRDVLVMFYEDLMSQTGFDRVLAFLGLAPMAAPLEVHVLQGARLRLEDDQRTQLKHRLAPQYAGVNARMGRLPDAWHDNWMRT